MSTLNLTLSLKQHFSEEKKKIDPDPDPSLLRSRY